MFVFGVSKPEGNQSVHLDVPTLIVGLAGTTMLICNLLTHYFTLYVENKMV